MLSLCLVIQRGMCVTPLGFCLRVIVNEKHKNLEKTTCLLQSKTEIDISSTISLFFK